MSLPARTHRWECADHQQLDPDVGLCRLSAGAVLASSDDRRWSTPTAVRSRNAPGAIPRGDFPACDPCRPEDPLRISALGGCRPDYPLVAAAANEYERRARSRRAQVGGRRTKAGPALLRRQLRRHDDACWTHASNQALARREALSEGLNKSTKRTMTTADATAGTSQMLRQSCVPSASRKASTTRPETKAPMK